MIKAKLFLKEIKNYKAVFTSLAIQTKQVFEILVDKQQHFSVFADTATLRKAQFLNSSDNTLFTNYQQHMADKGKISVLRNKN
ncbi:MAG: hypothetical protein IPF69_00290 [Chitinophagaceae bacterium]|nr:hypothetical protein [Chitinophagaceae bacterium]